MSITSINSATRKSTTVQKAIQTILVERGLWPLEKVRLVCETLKYIIYQTFSICDICVQV